MKTLYSNRKNRFISAKLKDLYNKKGIIIKHVIPYMHNKNNIAMQG